MKFLQQYGDSVVSLRFVYQEVPDRYESTESQEIVDLPTDAALALGKIAEADAILDQIATGDTDVEFGAQEWGDTSSLLAIINNTLGGDLGLLPTDDLDLYYRMQDRLREAESSGEVPGVYLYGDGEQESSAVKDLLPGFGESQEREIDLEDLVTGVEREANFLQGEVEHYAQRIEAGADTRLEMAELAGDITGQSLERDAQLSESGERAPDQPLVRVAARAQELPERLQTAVASVESDIAERFGPSAMKGFDPDQFA